MANIIKNNTAVVAPPTTKSIRKSLSNSNRLTYSQDTKYTENITPLIPPYFVGIFGRHSCGKSSLINYLLENENIRNSSVAMEDRLFTIICSEDYMDVVCETIFNNSNIDKHFIQFQKIKSKCPFMSDICFIDSPGLSDIADNTELTNIFYHLVNNIINIIFLTIDPTNLFETTTTTKLNSTNSTDVSEADLYKPLLTERHLSFTQEKDIPLREAHFQRYYRSTRIIVTKTDLFKNSFKDMLKCSNQMISKLHQFIGGSIASELIDNIYYLSIYSENITSDQSSKLLLSTTTSREELVNYIDEQHRIFLEKKLFKKCSEIEEELHDIYLNETSVYSKIKILNVTWAISLILLSIALSYLFSLSLNYACNSLLFKQNKNFYTQWIPIDFLCLSVSSSLKIKTTTTSLLSDIYTMISLACVLLFLLLSCGTPWLRRRYVRRLSTFDEPREALRRSLTELKEI